MPGLLAATTCTLSLLAAAPPASPETAPRVATRRVPISYSFSGHQVFLYGQLPRGSNGVFAVMEGPAVGEIRLMQKGKVVLFWMGVRQYELAHAPGLYLVNLHCPLCNREGKCPHRVDVETLNAALGTAADPIGPEAIYARTTLKVLNAELGDREHMRVIEGFWKLQQSRGLYGLRENAIRVSEDRAFYHVFDLPAEAPEGKYRILTHFLRDDTLVAVARNDLFVRQSGIIAWLSRLAEKHALTYGGFTVAIALLAGFLAGSLFRGARSIDRRTSLARRTQWPSSFHPMAARSSSRCCWKARHWLTRRRRRRP